MAGPKRYWIFVGIAIATTTAAAQSAPPRFAPNLWPRLNEQGFVVGKLRHGISIFFLKTEVILDRGKLKALGKRQNME